VDFETEDTISGGSLSEYGLLPEPTEKTIHEQVDYSNVMERIEQKEQKLAEVYDNRAATYASFVEELIKGGRVRTYTVAEDNLISRFNMHSSTKGDISKLNSVCSRPKSKEFPSLFFVKDIPVAGVMEKLLFKKEVLRCMSIKQE